MAELLTAAVTKKEPTGNFLQMFRKVLEEEHLEVQNTLQVVHSERFWKVTLSPCMWSLLFEVRVLTSIRDGHWIQHGVFIHSFHIESLEFGSFGGFCFRELVTPP